MSDFPPFDPAELTNSPQRESASSHEELKRIFNTALLATRSQETTQASEQLFKILESSEFKAICRAMNSVAEEKGVSKKEAAESLIHTFRNLDRLWMDYLFSEGIDKLKNQS